MKHADAHARALLEATTYVVLATADGAGEPWATPVWFAADGLERLYWLSWPGSRHSELVEHRPRIALTVFDTRAVPNEGAAFYATADARQCPDDRLDEGLAVYNRRAVAQGIPAFTRDRVTGEARLRLYVADVVEAWVLDQDAEVDQRTPVTTSSQEPRPSPARRT